MIAMLTFLCLVAQLGDNSWRVREAAHKEISENVLLYGSLFSQMKSEDQEINSRLAALEEKFYRDTSELKIYEISRQLDDYFPWIECVPSADADAYLQKALKAGFAAHKPNETFCQQWPAHCNATKIFLTEMLAAPSTAKLVPKILEEAKAKHVEKLKEFSVNDFYGDNADPKLVEKSRKDIQRVIQLFSH